MAKNPYLHFEKFILRTPLYPLDFFFSIMENDEVDDAQLKKHFINPEISEAIYLASPELHRQLKHSSVGDTPIEKRERLKYSFLKYLIRMSTRPTPFGLFAGCSTGQFGNETCIKSDLPTKNKRNTRLDMNYLVALSQDLANKSIIREQLHFYPNTSIYEVGGQLRYVEYSYNKGKRTHLMISVERDKYLEKILTNAEKGKKLNSLTKILKDDGIDEGVASNYINELVDSQLLVSELEPTVSGPEFLDQICSVLKNLENTSHVIDLIMKMKENLRLVDASIGNKIERYKEFENLAYKLGTDFERKFLVQTNLILNPKKNQIDASITESIKKGITLLNKISLPPVDTDLIRFKEAYINRYDGNEMPLATVLDVELGLGYKQNNISGVVNPLVDDISFPEKETETRPVRWSKINEIFHRKIFNAGLNKEYCIKLNESEFGIYEEDWEDLPDTISVMIEILEFNEKNKIRFAGFYGSSAANFMGRFCHGDKKIMDHVKSILTKEKEIHTEGILAEIVHLPESRVGNVLSRPSFRDYEIPYLCKSIQNEENQITIDELAIYLDDGKLKLKCPRLKQEIVPRLTNAHNYSSRQLPIYHFLCDMQFQQGRKGLGLDLGPFMDEYDFIPRIEFQNLILFEATWNIKVDDISYMYKIDNKPDLLNSVLLFQEKKNMPDFVMLVDGDNRLAINLKNFTSVKMLLETIKKRERITLKEFLYGCTNTQINCANEVIVSFYKQPTV